MASIAPVALFRRPRKVRFSQVLNDDYPMRQVELDITSQTLTGCEGGADFGDRELTDDADLSTPVRLRYVRDLLRLGGTPNAINVG